MYRIGELAKMAEVTPDTIRYYEKQQMMEHEVRTEGGFRLYTESDLQRLKFIRHARQLGFSLESIRELLSIRIDPEHHTCQESKGIVQERLQEVEARIAELQSMQRSLQRLVPVVGPPIAVFIVRFLKLLNKGRVALRVVDFALAGLHSRRKITNWSFYEPISAY